VKKYKIVSVFLLLSGIITGISFGYDITKFLYLDLKGEFNSPLVLKNAERINYTEGWKNLNAVPTAVKKISRIKFFLTRRKNINIYITIEKNQKLQKDLDISILINDKFLKKITVKLIGDSNLFIPLRFLNRGDNIITFSIDNGERIEKLFKTCTDINFFTIKDFKFKNYFLNSSSYKNGLKKNRFIQPVNTGFSVFITPETEKSINLEFLKFKNNKRGDLLEISYRSEKGNPEILKIVEVKNRAEKLNFNFENLRGDTNYIFSFKYSSPDLGNYIIWKKVEIIEKNGIKESSFFTRSKKYFRPNIFLIVLDAFRKDLINKIVDGKEVTPNLNKLFLLSTVYKKCYSTAPYTGASVSSMMTGLLPETHTVRSTDNILPKQIKTLPFFLNSEGYRSYALIGNPVITNSEIVRDFNKKTLIFKNPERSLNDKPESKNDIEKVIKAIREFKSLRPGLFYIHFLPPHPPYNPPGEQYKIFSVLSANKNNYRKMKECKNDDILFLKYLDNAFYADKLVGRVLKELKNRKLFENSLIIFTSDHGEAFCDHGDVGHGTTNYNELIHVPFFIKFPFQRSKVEILKPISLVDLTPSLVYLIKGRSYTFFQGQNIGIAESDKDGWIPRPVYSRAVGEKINSSLIYKNKKFILNAGSEEYYDLLKDPIEKIDQAKDKVWNMMLLKHKMYRIIAENLRLRKKLKIKLLKKKFSDKKREELKTLGYLL